MGLLNEKNKCLKLYNSGSTIQEISKITGISKSKVHNYVTDKKLITRDEIEEMNRLCLKGYSEYKIADMMGISRSSVREHLRSNDLKYDEVNDREYVVTRKQLLKIKYLYRKGYSLTAISEYFDNAISVAAIRYRLEKLGIYVKPFTMVSDFEREAMYKYYKAGDSFKNIAYSFGRDRKTVSRAIKKYESDNKDK